MPDDPRPSTPPGISLSLREMCDLLARTFHECYTLSAPGSRTERLIGDQLVRTLAIYLDHLPPLPDNAGPDDGAGTPSE